MMRALASILAGLVAAGCLSGLTVGMPTVTTPPPPRVEPVPDIFQAETAPPLVPTAVEGLSAAPALDDQLFYYAPHERWYRWALNRWYEAFAWDGNWFPPERLPPGFRQEQPFER